MAQPIVAEGSSRRTREETRLIRAVNKRRIRNTFSVRSSSTQVMYVPNVVNHFVLPSDCSVTREHIVAVSTRLHGTTENASPVKCNIMKMTDQIAALEFARPGK